MRWFRIFSPILLVGLLILPTIAGADDKEPAKKPDPKKPATKMVSGKSEVLRHVPKKWATLQAVDVAKRQVALLLEGEKEAKTWSLLPDAEIKIHGWWGRLDQFKLGDRVWVWFDIDKGKQPGSVLMLADEISEQDIHGTPVTVRSINIDEQTVAVQAAKAKESKTFKLADSIRMLDKDEKGVATFVKLNADAALEEHLNVGQQFFVQTAGDTLRLIVSADGLESLRKDQKALLRKRWAAEGLPGTVIFLHRLGGEMDFMLDHEAIRWGRHLKNGDKIKLKAADVIEAEVKEVRPWRERTQLRLVVSGLIQSELSLGQRVPLLMTPPPPEVDDADLPPDADRPRTKAERIEWFLCSTYCSCNVRGDTCTGMFYTLASCNVNACGMPNHIRELVAEMIDKGLTDKQIWEELKKSQGPLMLKPHLLQ